MAPSIAARRAMACKRPLSQGAAPGDGSAVCPQEPVLSTALLPPDEA